MPKRRHTVSLQDHGISWQRARCGCISPAVCEACMEVLHQLPTETEKAVESEKQGIAEIAPAVRISSRLAEAIEQFAQEEKRRLERPMRTLQQVLQEGGLRVGQIWRTRSDDIAVPGGEKEESVS